MIKPKPPGTIFEICQKQLYIPEGHVRITITNKEDFLKYVSGGGVYRSKDSDEEGYYYFYAFYEHPSTTALYKQKDKKL